ncbi:heavy metal translocating P-type ATPase [uncultured Duncaniella sp.]|uniref:heavy metal translocating P-type ATPase n=1 Tax=uncultured Duncaniella sp. TaxID=2768039 RepID=UPI0025F2EC4E|nr:heavy metal translocating P-type ATPase [uncultured Duncaniella sp.]
MKYNSHSSEKIKIDLTDTSCSCDCKHDGSNGVNGSCCHADGDCCKSSEGKDGSVAKTESSGCCCCGGHCHSGAGKKSPFVWPAVSFVLLIAGIVLNHLQAAWFTQPVVNLLWFVLAFLPVGLPVIKEGWEAALRKDVFSEFTLMIVASIGAFCIGEYPEAVAVMLFYTVGEILQHKAVDRATRNIEKLLDVRPERASVLQPDGSSVEMSPKEVAIGETIEVKPGERVPLDGELLDGEAMFDTSALTGESMPRTIVRGGEVLAGMIAAGTPVKVKVNRPYGESALSRILALVKDASSRKAPTEMFIRRFARVYTPIVMLLAVLIVAVPALVGAFSPSFHYVFSDWLYRGLVFLVISCPCALVVSVPLGYFAGIGAASRAGILFKGGNYLDALTSVDTVAFDKTGTLTTGRFDVTGIELSGLTERELLDIVLSVESRSTHPIAKAVVAYALSHGAEEISVTSMKEISGRGVEAVIDGKDILVGNLRLLQDRGIGFPDNLAATSATLVVCAVNNKYSGALFLADTIKSDSPDAIERLKGLGINEIHLLSGDKKEVVADYAAKLGIDKALGGLLPEDKAGRIEALIKNEGRKVAFVGDGMNDAPVLALSDVGIAMGGLGSDAAVESADVVIQTDQPSKVATAIVIARTTRAVVRENIIGAIGVKGIVLVAGALGYASLWGAVFADVGVALLAVLNSLRILYKNFK